MRRGDDLGPDERDRNFEGRKPPVPPRSGVSGRHVVIGVLVVLLIAFAIANFERTDVNFLLFDTQARVVTVIAVAGALGFAIGYFVGRPNKEQRKRLRRLEGED
jgi:uncharacterized membrane protein YciS (DUF1049 family)